MARRPREDYPGTWHHLINRGIAKRPLFEKRSDKRYFLARLARQVRSGRIEVHAYCLMDTHFHLLVRSPVGELSEAMRRVQNEHSRRFNRRNRRDGALIRGRFFSKPVRSTTYRRLLVRYIDANPVRAGMVHSSAEHEFGSAAAYLRGSSPPWLSRGWIESECCLATGQEAFTPAAYRATFGALDSEELAEIEELVHSRMSRSATRDPIEDLVEAAPAQIQAWMQRKAELADGHRPGLPVCGHRALRRALDENLEEHGVWMVEDGDRTWRGGQLAWLGLLRDLCGLTWGEVAVVGGVSASKARRLGAVHRRLLSQGGAYSHRAARVGYAAIGSRLRSRARRA